MERLSMTPCGLLRACDSAATMCSMLLLGLQMFNLILVSGQFGRQLLGDCGFDWGVLYLDEGENTTVGSVISVQWCLLNLETGAEFVLQKYLRSQLACYIHGVLRSEPTHTAFV
ncbi:hypothetical protein BDW66DRAFT_102865 [Aspergillus desertorum]